MLYDSGALISKANYFPEKLKNIGFTNVRQQSNASSFEDILDSDITDIYKFLIIEIKNETTPDEPHFVLCVSNIKVNNEVEVFDPRVAARYKMNLN